MTTKIVVSPTAAAAATKDANKTTAESTQLRAKEWLAWDQNASTKAEIQKLVDANDTAALSEKLNRRLEFGTAGLRAKMAAGYNAINDLVIIQTTQGILRYLQSQKDGQQRLKAHGVVIGYDCRHNSKRFAELASAIFMHEEYPVRLFSKVVPTPFVAYAVLRYTTVIGIVITASHNVKEDNGYKVYASNGAQIISPVDKAMQRYILMNLAPWRTSWDTSIVQKKAIDPLQDVVDSYSNAVRKSICREMLEINEKSPLTFTYTAMHGVGYNFVRMLFDMLWLRLVPVDEQVEPDPNFSTVKSPNPEEGKNALNLAIKTANRSGSNIVLANDPDADRLAVAEKNTHSGEWKIFTGNEMGALLGWWILFQHKLAYPNAPLKNDCMLSSTVSSMILKTMAKVEGFNFYETLTGFKWIANKILELNERNKQTLFAFEEAIGFMCGTTVLDKDGISAACQVATMANYLRQACQLDMVSKLDEIYNKYGYHYSYNSYFICRDPVKMEQIFQNIRTKEKNTYPTSFGKGKYPILGVRDLTTGFDSSQSNQKPLLPVSKSSQMITFTLCNGIVCTLRASGTEPKLKFYSEICAEPSQRNRKDLEKLLRTIVGAVIDELLEPKRNGLIPKDE